jgi:hypothetical protein
MASRSSSGSRLVQAAADGVDVGGDGPDAAVEEEGQAPVRVGRLVRPGVTRAAAEHRVQAGADDPHQGGQVLLRRAVHVAHVDEPGGRAENEEPREVRPGQASEGDQPVPRRVLPHLDKGLHQSLFPVRQDVAEDGHGRLLDHLRHAPP